MFFPYPDVTEGDTHTADLRIIKKLDIKPSDLGSMECVISKNQALGETLIGRPKLVINKYKGNLFEHLINLDISENVEDYVSQPDKEKIMEFVSKFSVPYPNRQDVTGQFRDDPNISFMSNGDEINWVFIPYTSKPQVVQVGFFEMFQIQYLEVRRIAKKIKENNLDAMEIEGVFNNYLSGNNLYLNSLDKQDFKINWRSKTCLNLCYLELYSLLLSKQLIKTCKYCLRDFKTAKGNVLVCSNCKDTNEPRKKYYYDHQQEEKEKAKLRMRKNRSRASV